MAKESHRWLVQAKADFKAARDNLKSRNFYLVAFLSHQTIEKGLKALYIEREREMPLRSHDLRKLAAAIGIPNRFRSFVSELNPAYIFARYPDATKGTPAQAYEREEVTTILKQAKEVFSWIQSQFHDSSRSSAA